MRLTLYLLRDGIEPSGDILRNSGRYTEVALIDPPEGLAWQLFSFSPPRVPVKWLPQLRTIAAAPDSLELYSQSSGAVLLATVSGRVFAITFGTGFHAVDPAHLEPDFGLRVAANSVDPERISNAEARGLGKGARNAVSSLPVPNRMFALRLSTNEEWIRRMGGFSLDTSFAVSVNGADSLRLNVADFELVDLDPLLRASLTKFNSTDYREHLPHLDYFRRLAVTHPLVSTLDQRVVAEMRDRHADIGFAAPDELNFYNVDEFTLTINRRRETLPDLSANAVYGALDALDAWSDPLQVRVRARSEGDWLGPPRPLYQYLVADVGIDPSAGGQPASTRYVLTAGVWFSIAPDYAAQLDEVIGRVPDITAAVALPAWNNSWLKDNVAGTYAEQRYNRHAADTHQRTLMDRDLYRGPAGERVEACDVLDDARRLICVKRLDGSDTMIHLFEQGMVSAVLLRANDAYRDFVLGHLEKTGAARDFGSESDWTVVFAIATSRPGPIKSVLPFFARASLVANIGNIQARGFQVALAKIDMTD